MANLLWGCVRCKKTQIEGKEVKYFFEVQPRKAKGPYCSNCRPWAKNKFKEAKAKFEKEQNGKTR